MNEVTTRSSRGAPIHSPVESPRGIVQTFNGVAAGGLFSLGVLGAGGVLVTGATAALVAPFLPLLAIVGLATLSVGTISAFDSGAVDAVLEGNATEAEGFLFGGTVVGIGTLGVGAAAGAARGVAPVRATSAARGSGSTIRANKAAGDAFEAAIGAELRATHEVVAPQVTIRTPSGTRTRVDFVTRDGTSIGCVECKASATAPLTRNQAAAFPEIQQSGGVVMGKGKPGVPGGTVIPPRTQVRIRRP